MSKIILEDWQQEIVDKATAALELQNDYLDKILTRQNFYATELFEPDNRVEYEGFWIECEYPNGGMTAISVMDFFTKAWWSFPCGIKGVQPFFDYEDADKAIAWIKTVIDGIPTGSVMSDTANGQHRIYRFHFDSPAMRWIDRDNFIEEDPFHYEVDSFEQAIVTLKMLKAYDDYQQKYHGMEPDACDCYGLEIYLNGEWIEWKAEDCENIQEYIEGDVVYVLGENA